MKKFYTLAAAALTFFCASAQTETEAPENDVDLTEWTYLGEGTYEDGILTVMEDDILTYTVPVYQSKTDSKTYLFYNIAPADLIPEDYTQTDGKPSQVTFTVDSDNAVTAKYDFNITYYGESALTVDEAQRGTYEDGVITFNANSILLLLDGSQLGFGNRGFKAALPGTDIGGGDEPTTDDIDLTKWDAIGESEYTDGIIYSIWRSSNTIAPYNVITYRNKENPNQFLLANVFPAEVLDEVTGNGVALRNNKESNLILTVDPSSKEVTPELNSTVYFYEEEGEDQDITITATGTKGTFDDGTITLPTRTFLMDSWAGNNPSNPITIKLPEGTELEGETTGIATIATDAANGEAKIYDLTGRRVATPAAGNVYIVNGVKVLVK